MTSILCYTEAIDTNFVVGSDMKTHPQAPAFLPATPEEMHHLGWKQLDVVLVTGDAYIDAPSVGVAVIGRVLMDGGYRVGIIVQPNVLSDRDIGRPGGTGAFLGCHRRMSGFDGR